MSSESEKPRLEKLASYVLWTLVDHMDYPEVHALAQCSKTLHANVDVFLYKREKKDGKHKALHYAVDKMQDDDGVRTITKLTEHIELVDRVAYFNVRFDHDGGYSHPLHISAMRNHPKQVRKLLELGADARAMCRNLMPLVSRSQRQRLRAMRLDQILKSCEWSATLIPLMCDKLNICGLLYQRHPSAILARSLSESGRAITTHHLTVIQDRLDILDEALHFHPGDINVQTPKTGQTPLHLAILHERPFLVDRLVHFTTLNGIFNRDGANVLHLAIEETYLTDDAPRRRWLAQVVERLLAHGADPNESKANLLRPSPLLLATEAVRYDWYRVWREVKQIIDLLLQHGADVNRADGSGSTPLTTVVKRIIRDKDSGSMKTMFLDLVEKHGADVNLRPQFVGQPLKSIMFRLIDAPRMVALCKKVVMLGGRVAQHEKCEYDIIGLHGSEISDQDINQAYEYALAHANQKSLQRLQGSGRPYEGGDTRLVWRHLLVSGARLPAFTRTRLQPDWRYVDAHTGMSLLHMVVSKAAMGGEYTEEMAVSDVKVLTGTHRNWGCLVMFRDPEGKTALDRVVDMGERFQQLRGELTRRHGLQAKRPDLCQVARDLEQGWLQDQQSQ
ncbi:hypothetical protein CEP52_000747 [Fusarium oligoseptatum]|uniref:Ankyrin repeat protein n=1 Tax=Fusarium oligoseptatum TaxID=2604345 RepID=A0A428UMT1_9HYPO|nr:hypothetical protein CEP52_000747 [Fusarium oligoseptatum]